jgi:acyl carrier protein
MGGTEQAVKDFILAEFLEGEDPENLTPSTSLIGSGVLDSLATLKLVTFLEETFEIAIEPHEADEENLDSIASIVRLVESKRPGG